MATLDIPSISLDPGAEYDFALGVINNLLSFTPDEWNGDSIDSTILNSEDGSTQADVTIPVDIYLSYCIISNLAVTGPFKIYANSTCVDGGNNNANVVFLTTLPSYVLVGGLWNLITQRYILIGGLWKTITDHKVVVSSNWK